MSIREFIKQNKEALDAAILRVCPGLSLNDQGRRQWIANDEGLYKWARSQGVRI